jgi:hypothetical protein
MPSEARFDARFECVLAAAKTGAAWALALLYREFQPGLLRYLTEWPLRYSA